VFKRVGPHEATLEINEYIEKFSEIKPHLDELLQLPIVKVKIINDGCKAGPTLKIFRYLHAHDIRTIK
jgi:hypothetical protein